MLVALILIVLGVLAIASIPILGWIIGLLLILVGIAVAVLAMLGRSIGAIVRAGTTKTCPDCKSQIPSDAKVCRHCGYRYPV
jgi:hypothetical protein